MTGGYLTHAAFPQARRRLAREIHRRAYHDVGAEVSPGPAGPELTRAYRVGTPHCKKGDRTLGELTWESLQLPDGTWTEFRQAAFGALGLVGWFTREHKGCFHRRGKARYDLTFAVAARLVEDVPEGSLAVMWALDPAGDPDERFAAMLTAAGHPAPPDRPSRHLAVTCCGEPLAALRSDGWTITPRGPLAVDHLWWSGLDEQAAAHAVRRVAQHAHPSAGVAR